jgi:hypothetical protein
LKYTYCEPPEGINNPPTNHVKEALLLASGLLVGIVGVFFLLGLAADRLVQPRRQRRRSRGDDQHPGDSTNRPPTRWRRKGPDSP